MSKIFVIGFNKTATTTFHKLFLVNKLKSQHATPWNPDMFQCFSDNGNMNNFKQLDKNYPDATFILNVRSLDKWLKSRIAHGYHEYLKNKEPNWGYPCNISKCKSWIEAREKHHSELLEYFKDRPHKLIIVNIEKDNWEQYISDILGLKVKSIPPKNVSKIDKDKIPFAFKSMNKTFKQLGYSDIDKQNILLRNRTLSDTYITMYRNNIM